MNRLLPGQLRQPVAGSFPACWTLVVADLDRSVGIRRDASRPSRL